MSDQNKAHPTGKTIGKQMREQMTGEHSLQVDQGGESFRGKKRARGATIYQHQQGDVPQIHQPGREEEDKPQQE